MKTLSTIKNKFRHAFTELYEACCVAEGWLEEGSDRIALGSIQHPDVRRGTGTKSRVSVNARRVA